MSGFMIRITISAAVFGALALLALCFYISPADAALLAPMAMTHLVTLGVPIFFKHRHVQAQNRLLERCRALLMTGVHSLYQGDRDTAIDVLDRIRQLERRWRFGNSRAFRFCHALSTVGSVVVLCFILRYLGFLAPRYISGQSLSMPLLRDHLVGAGALSISGLIAAIAAYRMPWDEPRAIDDCGDRLWQLIHGARTLTVPADTAEAAPDFDKLRAREIFGLNPAFTRRDLDHARRGLVWELHPDRLRGLRPKERRAREDALKQVNAAYDRLRAEAA